MCWREQEKVMASKMKKRIVEVAPIVVGIKPFHAKNFLISLPYLGRSRTSTGTRSELMVGYIEEGVAGRDQFRQGGNLAGGASWC